MLRMVFQPSSLRELCLKKISHEYEWPQLAILPKVLQQEVAATMIEEEVPLYTVPQQKVEFKWPTEFEFLVNNSSKKNMFPYRHPPSPFTPGMFIQLQQQDWKPRYTDWAGFCHIGYAYYYIYEKENCKWCRINPSISCNHNICGTCVMDYKFPSAWLVISHEWIPEESFVAENNFCSSCKFRPLFFELEPMVCKTLFPFHTRRLDNSETADAEAMGDNDSLLQREMEWSMYSNSESVYYRDGLIWYKRGKRSLPMDEMQYSKMARYSFSE